MSPIISGGGGGGGGSQPITRCQINGSAVTIADGANGVLTWNTLVQGDTLIDLTNPAAPAVIAAGVYAFHVQAFSTTNMTVGGVVRLKLAVDLNGDDYEVGPVPSAAAVTANLKALAAIPLTWYSPAGGVLEARCYNADGAQSLDFVVRAFVQRIS